MSSFSIIVAVDKENGIGKGGTLPWHIPQDLKHFKRITTQTKNSLKKNVVVMGRKTWESIPEKFRPLPDRINCVLSRNPQFKVPEGVVKVEDFDGLLSKLENTSFADPVENVFIIGGAEIFKIALNHSSCKNLILTHIDSVFDCDTFFPAYNKLFKKTSSSEVFKENAHSFYFAEYQQVMAVH